MMSTRWMAVGVVVVLIGCNAGPPRIEAIDEPLELPVEVTLIEAEEFYPAGRQSVQLREHRGRLYRFGGVTTDQISPTERNTTMYYDVWMSEDGIRWSQLTEEFYPGVAEIEFGYAFYSFDGYLWAAETINRRLNPDAPQELRLFRSVDGVEWEVVNEDYSIDGYAGPMYVIDGTVTELSGLQADSFFPATRVRFSRNGVDWPETELEFTDANRFFDRFFPSITISDKTAFILDIFDNRLGRFDVDTLVWEALSIDPATHAQLFLTEVVERDARFGAAFVGHNGYLYIIAGRGRSAQNEWHPLQERPNWLNDVWRSPDGVAWERMGEQIPFTEEELEERGYRYNFDTFPARVNPQVVSWRGVLYLTGGGGSARWDGEWISHGGQDAWVSRDGETWYELARVRDSRILREPLLSEPTPEQMDPSLDW